MHAVKLDRHLYIKSSIVIPDKYFTHAAMMGIVDNFYDVELEY